MGRQPQSESGHGDILTAPGTLSHVIRTAAACRWTVRSVPARRRHAYVRCPQRPGTPGPSPQATRYGAANPRPVRCRAGIVWLAAAACRSFCGPRDSAARRPRVARPKGRSAASGGNFGGRAWEALRHRSSEPPKAVDLYGEPGGTRTHDPKIKSLVLYHLSYGLAAGRMAWLTLLHIRGNAHVHDTIRVLHDPATAGAALDLVDVLQSLHHLAPNGVLPIQMRRRGEHDVELAVAAVR